MSKFVLYSAENVSIKALQHSVWGCLGALTLSVKFLSSSSHINLITAVLIELRNSEIGRFKGSN